MIKTTPATLALDAARRAIGELRDAAGTLSRSLTHLALALDDGDQEAASRHWQHVEVAGVVYDQAVTRFETARDRLWTAHIMEAQP